MRRLLLVPAALAAALFGFGAASAINAQTQAEPIGYQSGIAASVNAWCEAIPKRCTGFTKLGVTLKKLADDYDARVAGTTPPPTETSPPPPPPPPPPPSTVAPMTFNAEMGSNARYCVEGLPRNSQGRYYDDYATYDENGLQWGGRTETYVPGLRGARSMDGLGPCSAYGGYPPWPAGSYQR